MENPFQLNISSHWSFSQRNILQIHLFIQLLHCTDPNQGTWGSNPIFQYIKFNLIIKIYKENQITKSFKTYKSDWHLVVLYTTFSGLVKYSLFTKRDLLGKFKAPRLKSFHICFISVVLTTR